MKGICSENGDVELKIWL